MKYFILSIALIFTTLGFTQETDEKLQKVEQLMSEMMDNELDIKLANYVSPSYIKSNNLIEGKHQLNAYSPTGYKITDEENGLFKVEIWGDNKIWIHELFFKLIKEKGSYYFEPSGIESGNYVNLWAKVKSNIEAHTNKKTLETELKVPEPFIEKNEQYQFVKQVLSQMKSRTFSMYVSDYVQTRDMRKHKVKNMDFKINTYAPNGFKITSNEGDLVQAYVWGENYSWIHQITFKTIRKKGRLYFPIKSVTANSYVNIWEEVKQNVKVDSKLLE
jgi:hypothetical protein